MSLNIEKTANNIENIAQFEKDKIFFFCYNKLNKLLKAVAVLTKDNQANSLVKDMLIFSVEILSSGIKFFMEGSATHKNLVLEKILIISSLIETTSSLNYLSENNAKILISEYSLVANIISKAKPVLFNENLEKELESEYFFDKDTDHLEKNIREILQKRHGARSIVKSNLKDIELSYRNDLYNKQNSMVSGALKPSGEPLRKENASSYLAKTNKELKTKDNSERTKSIINIIKDNKSVTIKDISNIVQNISEKTIQRELASLVYSGTLKREGERRWSRYSLR